MKYIILGGGPAGLTFANRLKQLGEDSFIVLEKEKEAGGLCRSSWVDGAPLDIGGGHFLDVRRPKVTNFLFEFMSKEEWDLYERNSQISINGTMINSPFEANIWQFDLKEQIEYLKSIAVAGCNLGNAKPEYFVDWIKWKLGDKIAEEYMIPYNKKMFANELNELGTYWLDKLPNVSFEETLLSCLEKKSYGEQPGHAKFYYPKKYGYGEVWNRMARRIERHIRYGVDVKYIDINNGIIKSKDNEEFQAEYIISSIPWNEIKFEGMPQELVENIKKLKHTSIETRYFSEKLNTKAQWIYCPDEKLPYHRILVRSNFCLGSRGYWTETRKDRVKLFEEDSNSFYSYINLYAYPLNTIGKQEIMRELLAWSEKRNFYGIGRWGKHEHYNSDVVVEQALELAEYFGAKQVELWKKK